MKSYLEIISHDAFRYGGRLNKSAAEVYWCLLKEPMTVNQLIDKTGRSRTTIYRCLFRMARIWDGTAGDYAPLVKKQNKVWIVVPYSDLDHISVLIGTDGIGKRKHEQYIKERLKYENELRRRNLLSN